MAEVACTTCGLVLDSSKADVTGRGYRCSTCSLKASIDANLGTNDVGDHLTPAEREAAAARALQHMIGGGAAFVVLMPIYVIIPFKLIAIGAFGGLGLAIRGYVVRRQMAGHVVS